MNAKILSSINKFFEDDISKTQKISLILSDAASYAVKVSNLLKEIIPKLKRVTCLFHGLHNLCESIREDNTKLDRYISSLKGSLIKNRKNKSLIKIPQS